MTTGDVVYSLRFSLIKILPEPGFDPGSTAGESCVLTARLHMLYGIRPVYPMSTHAPYSQRHLHPQIPTINGLRVCKTGSSETGTLTPL